MYLLSRKLTDKQIIHSWRPWHLKQNKNGIDSGKKENLAPRHSAERHQHKGCICNTQYKQHSAQMTLSLIAQAPLCRLSLCRMLHFIYCCAEYHYAECHYSECHYAECHYAECHYAECHYAECHHAECRILFIGMLSVVMLNVIMLIVAAPKTWVSKQKLKFVFCSFTAAKNVAPLIVLAFLQYLITKHEHQISQKGQKLFKF